MTENSVIFEMLCAFPAWANNWPFGLHNSMYVSPISLYWIIILKPVLHQHQIQTTTDGGVREREAVF